MVENLISLSEFESASGRQEAGRSTIKSLSLFYGFLALIAVSAAPGRLAAEADPAQYWKMLLPPVIIVMTGTPFVLWHFRSHYGSQKKSKSAEACPECGAVCNKTAVRLTGRCMSCGHRFVNAPVEDKRRGIYNLDEVRRAAQKANRLGLIAVTGLFVGMLLCFCLATVAGESRVIAAGGLVCLAVMCIAFVVTLTYAQQVWKAFRCPHCGKSPQNHLWLISAGACEHCLGPMIPDTVVRPSALLDLSRTEFAGQNRTRRNRALSLAVAGLLAMTVVFGLTVGTELYYPAATPVMRAIGVWPSTVFAVAGIGALFGFPSARRRMTCRECKSWLCDTPHTIVTGNCSRCGAVVLR